jgi:hypothetical protein
VKRAPPHYTPHWILSAVGHWAKIDGNYFNFLFCFLILFFENKTFNLDCWKVLPVQFFSFVFEKKFLQFGLFFGDWTERENGQFFFVVYIFFFFFLGETGNDSFVRYCIVQTKKNCAVGHPPTSSSDKKRKIENTRKNKRKKTEEEKENEEEEEEEERKQFFWVIRAGSCRYRECGWRAMV